jgi:heme/copper-type cytochrome/quinol oxidase subunit 3
MERTVNFFNVVNFSTPFHLVDRSPWPFLTGFLVLQVPLALLIYISTSKVFIFFCSFFLLLYVARRWAGDVVVEGTFQGMHTKSVQKSIVIGYLLFIVSEVMLFASFFGSYFYCVVEPSLWVGGIKFASPFLSLIDPWALPLLNSVLLLSSSVFVTFAHYEIAAVKKLNAQGDQAYILLMLLLTILLGALFSACQWYEYNYAQFSIQDTAYGSIFYLITGFHGLHVIIGLIFLSISFRRIQKYHFTVEHHLGFEFSALYWHFVDAVWFFVYTFLYVYVSF